MTNANSNPAYFLTLADKWAESMSGCLKVKVGSMILPKSGGAIFGANRGVPSLCMSDGCMRIAKYGNDSKAHRNPEDCRAVHSEVNAIAEAARLGVKLQGATIYVTRYPCEACARAIAIAGIKKVYYGGTAKISEETKKTFTHSNIEVTHVEGWKEDFTDR